MVGLTVLVGMVLMGVLLLKFGAFPAAMLGPSRMTVELDVARADGLSVGSSMNYLGVNIGNVTVISRSADETHVIITAVVDAKNPPPGNVVGRIRSQIVGGGSNISLEVPEGGKPEGRLAAHARIRTLFIGVDILPPEFAQLATELRLTSQQLRDAKLVEHIDEAVRSVHTQLEKAGKLMDTLDSTVGDPKMRENITASVANIRTATETANRVGANLETFSQNLDKLGQNLSSVSTHADETITKTQGHIDDVSKQLGDRLLQVGKLLEQFQSIAAKVDQGKGTAGQLINDPKLYESLVNTSSELNLTITEMKLLVKQWKDEGAYIKLNK